MLAPVLGERAASPAQPLQRPLDWLRANRFLVAAAALCGAVVALHYSDLRDAPPGFFSDEASVSYDAQGIATDLRDEHGDLLPIFFQSFGQWRASLFVYAVAMVFRVAGPGVVQARFASATFSLLTALLMALLVHRLFGERWLSLGTFAVVGVTPWLFTSGRLAFEPIALPAVLAGFLLLWHRADQTGRWYDGAAAGFVLGLSVYAAIVAWLFAPLLCLALALAELPRVRRRQHREELASLDPGRVAEQVVRREAARVDAPHPAQVLEHRVPGQPHRDDLVPRREHARVQGGEFLAVLAPALAVGLFALWTVRRERFWRLVFLGLLFAPIPSALASDFSHEFRNIEDVPFFLAIMALGVWRVWPLVAKQRLVAAGLAGLLAFQAVWFLADYYTRICLLYTSPSPRD